MRSDFLKVAEEAALAAGGLLRANFGRKLVVDANEAHDIKLELDRSSQRLIEEHILSRFPEHCIYGEEGLRGDQSAEYQWILDPIDGTVNFFCGIPHFCISVALRRGEEILVGVIHDPMRDEVWTTVQGGAAYLNGLEIAVSDRRDLAEAFVSVGFSKTQASIDRGLPVFERMVRGAKKCRMMGSAALDMAYVATGRLDAYMERSISLWDVAAGILLVRNAGGSVDFEAHDGNPDKYRIVASNGKIPVGEAG